MEASGRGADRKRMGKLEGKTTLIAGDDSGIGLATAKQFVNEGAYVFIVGRRDRELANSDSKRTHRVIFVPTDSP
jgi:NAD(P)-dependent dehydrogenase (short-subunit alcohol dehydrogenase family)